MEKDNFIVYNAIRTPDGTVLVSEYTHDYKTYVDKNGKTYMVDGGKSYLRRSNNGDEEVLSICSADEPFSVIREYFTWGTFGKNGDEPRVFKKLKDLTTDHIKAILETQHQINESTRTLLETELKYRETI